MSDVNERVALGVATGTEAEIKNYKGYVGAEGEIVFSLDGKRIYVFDGEKVGGFRVAMEEDIKTIVRYVAQSLTEDQKGIARNNISAANDSEVIKHLVQSLNETQKQQARQNIDAASRNETILKTFNRGALAGYEASGSGATVNDTSPDTMTASGNITVANGSAGTAWTKAVTMTSVLTVTLGSSWYWAGGKAPTIKAPALLVCHWNGTVGIANITNGAA